MEQLEQSRISRREGGGSRASQGVNYARKQYYRTNYRTGERNSVKCRAAHYQPPLPRECTPRYINYLGGWPIGQIQRETAVLSLLPFSLPSTLSSFSFLSLFFQFFNFIPLLPRVSAALSAESGTKLWPRFSTGWKIFFRSRALLTSKSNQVVLLGIYNYYWNIIMNYWNTDRGTSGFGFGHGSMIKQEVLGKFYQRNFFPPVFLTLVI